MRPYTAGMQTDPVGVVVLDDDAAFCKVVKRGLSGWRVVTYSDVHPFFELAEAGGLSALDALLLDYTLPGTSALDVLEWLGGKGIRMPVVVASGTVAAREEGHLVSRDVPVLLKPVTLNVLREWLLKAIRDFHRSAPTDAGSSITIDLDLLVARAGTDRSSLTVQHGLILAKMLECRRAGRIATDAELMAAAWPDGDGSVRKLVVNVDRMTRRVPVLEAVIERIRDHGYRIRLPRSESGTMLKVTEGGATVVLAGSSKH